MPTKAKWITSTGALMATFVFFLSQYGEISVRAIKSAGFLTAGLAILVVSLIGGLVMLAQFVAWVLQERNGKITLICLIAATIVVKHHIDADNTRKAQESKQMAIAAAKYECGKIGYILKNQPAEFWLEHDRYYTRCKEVRSIIIIDGPPQQAPIPIGTVVQWVIATPRHCIALNAYANNTYVTTSITSHNKRGNVGYATAVIPQPGTYAITLSCEDKKGKLVSQVVLALNATSDPEEIQNSGIENKTAEIRGHRKKEKFMAEHLRYIEFIKKFEEIKRHGTNGKCHTFDGDRVEEVPCDIPSATR